MDCTKAVEIGSVVYEEVQTKMNIVCSGNAGRIQGSNEASDIDTAQGEKGMGSRRWGRLLPFTVL